MVKKDTSRDLEFNLMDASIFKNKFKMNYYIILTFIFVLNSFFRSEFICILPLILLALIKKLNSQIIISSLISSLLLIEVGNTINDSLSTPPLIRYLCLFAFTLYILVATQSDFVKQFITTILLFTSQVISFSITNTPYRSINEAIVMLSYLGIIIFIGFRSLKENSYECNYDNSNLIINLGFIYGISLLVSNQFLIIFYSIDYNFLSSFSSLKGFILISLSLSLYKKGLIKSIPLVVLTFLVCIYTAARTHILMFLLIMTLSILSFIFIQIKEFHHKKSSSILSLFSMTGSLGFGIIYFKGILETEFPIKTLGVFYKVFESQSLGINFEKILLVIDPFRYYETREWVNSGINTIIFGNGLGSGINIKDLLFADISEMGAYSQKAMNSGIAYSLHDVWTWYGLSIGLIGMIIITIPIIFFRPYFKLDRFESHLLNLSLLFSFGTMWYSLSGNLLFWGIIAILRKNNHYNNPSLND
tara:strand:- start:266 stop:1690 length:1425 start_codon:yes stop_codon:yes gene_type:complete